MKKNDTLLDNITKNAKNLIPYIGVLFVAAGIIGLLFVQSPLQTSQDVRSDAATADQLVANQPRIESELRVPLVVNRTGELAFSLQKANHSFSRVHLVFSISNRYIDTPEIVVNQGSGFDAEKIEIEQISDGYLVNVVAIPNNLNWLVEPQDKSLVKVRLVPRRSGTLVVNFDQDRTYGDTRSSEVLIAVPGELRYQITGSGSGSEEQQALCAESGGIWRQFSDGCVDSCEKAANPSGIMCTLALTMGCDCGAAQCWNGTSCTNNPGSSTPPPTIQPSPPVTPPVDCSQFTTSETCSSHTLSYCAWYACASACHPRGTPTETVCPPQPAVQGCNETCSNNSQCQVGMRCYSEGGQSRCRLATNPTSASCQPYNPGNNQTPLRSCNQSCGSNADCTTGLTCWSGTCRNPENPQSANCAAPTTQQSNLIINGCSQRCTSNAECAINLRCYEGECRLATNPSSTSCSAVTKQTVSTAYLKKAGTVTSVTEIAETDTPIQKGTNLIPDDAEATDTDAPSGQSRQSDETSPGDTPTERRVSDDSYQADETMLGLLKSLILNSDSKLPLFIILFGIMLLVLSILASVLSRAKKTQITPYHPSSRTDQKIDVKTYDVKPGDTTKSTAAKELLKTLENRSKD